MLAVQPAVTYPQMGGLGLWHHDAEWSALEPVSRCLSLNGAKDATADRLASLYRVQLSTCSDSALLDSAARRGKVQRTASPSSASAPVLRLTRPLGGATATSHLSSLLQQIHTWDRFDVFKVAALTQGKPLYTVAMAIFEALGLMNWKLDRRKVEAFLTAAEQAYGRNNPYHNSTHAADVVQAAFIMLRSVQQPQFTKLEVFGLLLAAIVHDIGHPGLTNDFLAKTNDPLAAAHGATSVNERHHLATAFSIAANEDTNVFAGLSPAEEQQVRDSMRSAVLCTDMAQHSKLVDQLEFARQSHPVPSSPPAARPAQQRGGPAALASAPASGLHASGSQAEQLGRLAGKPVAQYTAGDRLLLLKALLHLADLSNPARPLPTGATWGCLVAKEFLAQGDRERRLGLPVTPACDRDTVVVSTSQLRFIDMFLRPLLEQMRGVLGEALRLQLLRRLGETEEHWRRHQARVAAGADPLGP